MTHYYREARPERDHTDAVARAFLREAHRRALDTVAATDAVWLKRDTYAVPQRP